jgi:hypothetical protein
MSSRIKRASALGVKATTGRVDFQTIMSRMRLSVEADRHMEESVAHIGPSASSYGESSPGDIGWRSGER